jgi:ABC-type multidrug transport system fused ATPase/permease subunit
MHHLIAHSFTDLVSAVATPLVAIGYMLSIDWRFTIVVTVPVIVGLFVYSRQMSGYGENSARYNAAQAEVNSAAVEFVQGIAVVKAFGQTGRALGRFIGASDRFVQMFWEWVRGLLRISTIGEVLLSPLFSLLVIAAAGTMFAAQGWLPVVALVPVPARRARSDRADPRARLRREHHAGRSAGRGQGRRAARHGRAPHHRRAAATHRPHGALRERAVLLRRHP